MSYRLLRRWVRRVCMSISSFLCRSFYRTMGCFFTCFRIRDSKPRSQALSSSLPQVGRQGGAISKNQLSILLSEEDKKDFVTVCHSVDNTRPGSPKFGGGTLDEAVVEPVEFLQGTQTDVSVIIEDLENQLATKRNQEKDNAQISSEDLSVSCISNAEINQGTPLPEGESEDSFSPGTVTKLEYKEAEIPPVSIEITTPPPQSDTKVIEKDFNLRNPIQKTSVAEHQPLGLEIEEISHSLDTIHESEESSARKTEASPKECSSLMADTISSCSYSVGSKPSYADYEDRPIVGMVAAHWHNMETSSCKSPKWWKGNGIPNSTTKYKEDQKVNWHATPFEERLEKALSEENVVPKKKHMSERPFPFDIGDDGDGALPHMITSVESF